MCQYTLGPGLKSHAQFHNSYALFPIQCNDDGYFSSPPHLACESHIQQGNSLVMSLLAAGVIHIPPLRHTDLSLADWNRLSFTSGVSWQKTTVVFSNVVSKNKHDRTTKLYTHIYKTEHSFVCTLTHFFTLLFILPSTGFEPGFPASLLSPITTTLFYLLLLPLLK